MYKYDSVASALLRATGNDGRAITSSLRGPHERNVKLRECWYSMTPPVFIYLAATRRASTAFQSMTLQIFLT
eukprot:scaffold14763_cov137-Amphora_coffeaeformis.AAC.3